MSWEVFVVSLELSCQQAILLQEEYDVGGVCFVCLFVFTLGSSWNHFNVFFNMLNILI